MRTFSLSSAARLNSWSTGSSALKNSDQPTSGAGGLAERVTAMRFDHNIATDGLFVNAQRFSTRPYTPAVEAVSCIGCAATHGSMQQHCQWTPINLLGTQTVPV